MIKDETKRLRDGETEWWAPPLPRTSSLGLSVSSSLPPHIPRGVARARGFSFAEVMFAVIILGIGFIMVAAIFPVAIQQQKLTADESTAAAIARTAANSLEQLALGAGQLFPETQAPSSMVPPLVYSMRNWTGGFNMMPPQPGGTTGLSDDTLWQRLRGNLVMPSDRRFAWTALYSREAGSPFIRVYVFVLQLRNRTIFEAPDYTNGTTFVNLQPRLLAATVHPAPPGSSDPDWVEFNDAFDQQCAAEGSYLIVAEHVGAPATNNQTGRVYRLGLRRDLGRFEVDPAYDVPDIGTFNASVWVVGAGMKDPADPTQLMEGEAMDVAMYTTFLRVQ